MIPELSPLSTTSIEILPWDSEFFGRRIGRVKTSDITDRSLEAAVAAGRKADLDCLYLTLIPSDFTVPSPEHFGFHLVDVQLDLERKLRAVISRELSQLVVRPGLRTDFSALRPVIDALAPWSRFAMDPRFGVSAAGRMYFAWLDKSAETDGRLFAVAILNTKPVGLITVENGSPPKIGLIGSSESGLGIGRLLLDHAAEWAFHYAQTLSVTTQARNVVALRFYCRNGFEVKSARYVYHLWLTRSVPGS